MPQAQPQAKGEAGRLWARLTLATHASKYCGRNASELQTRWLSSLLGLSEKTRYATPLTLTKHHEKGFFLHFHQGCEMQFLK